MAAQDWQSPYPTSDPYAVAAAGTPPPPYASRYELRPLAAGEVLDRVFSLYRSHFWFFAGLSAVSAGVSAATAILRLIYLHFVPINLTSPTAIFANSAIGMVQGVVYLIAYSLTHAAISSAVQAFYLGEPTSFEIALKVARRLWLRCLGIAIWQAWSGIWVFLALLIPFFALATFAASSFAWIAVILGFGMFGSVIYGVIAYLRNSLAVPAAVVEDLGVRAAMRRS